MHKKSQNKVPELRFPEFKGEWNAASLGHIADIFDGTHQTPRYVQGGIPFVSVEDINGIEKTTKFITEDDFHKDFKNKPQVDDILMTRITAGVIGATALVASNAPLAYYVSLALIRKKTDLLARYLSTYMNTAYFKRELHKRVIHVAFPKKINLGDIGHCAVAFPHLSEQRKIAAFLLAVDRRIEGLEKTRDLLKEYKKGLIQQLLDRTLRFMDDNGKPFPDWERWQLGHVAEIKKGEQLNADTLNDSGAYPALNGGMRPSGYTDQWNVDADTIAISEGGNSCGFVNYMTQKFWCGGHCYALLNLNKGVLNRYLFQALKHTEPLLMRLRVGSGLPNIQKADISKVIVKIPSLAEQKKIADCLLALDRKIEAVAAQVSRMQDFKQGLLQKMFV